MSFKEKAEKLFTYLPPSLDSVKGKLYENDALKTTSGGNAFGYEPYIQHIPEMIDKIQGKFVELCVQEKILPDKFLKGKIHRQEAIGRYLDDSGSGAYKYWNRFMCIDENYREWLFPYYAINFEQEGIHGVCINNLSPDLVTFFREHKINSIINEK